ncbi:MAG: glycoside hydrolase family 88 protein [Prolixibacteraceae bacterium]
MKIINYSVLLFTVLILAACAGNKESAQADFNGLTNEISEQLKVLVAEIPEDKVPRSYPDDDGTIRFVGYRDWTCGFPAGSFWYMYEFTGNDYWKETAIENTVKLDGVQYLTNTHDLGFMVFCSYGNGYRLTGNEAYKDVIIQASESLITRFDPDVGCIRSWDFGHWEFPVIIDNMMNLEMLLWASEQTNDPKYREIALSHADVTLEHHYRDDWSCYHVVSFDTITGEVIEKQTHQGLNDESAWARGQAWGLYGYVMMYRETNEEKYLQAAENIADFILNELPEDMVPYWDFDDPDIPQANRDASAGAIIASALYELSTFSGKGEVYRDAANAITESLTSEKYRAVNGQNAGFILMHSVGNMPGEDEIDVAINYADYYYLEALKRKQEL